MARKSPIRSHLAGATQIAGSYKVSLLELWIVCSQVFLLPQGSMYGLRVYEPIHSDIQSYSGQRHNSSNATNLYVVGVKDSMQALVRLGLSCNQNCRFCNVKYALKTKSTADAKEEILEVIREYQDTSLISFTGGEPTLRNDLPELISFVKKKTRMNAELQTNAMRCSYKGYVAALKKAGLDCAFVALHSHKESVSDWLTRTPGSFKLTIDGIKNLLDECIEVTLNIVITSANYKLLPEFSKFVHENFTNMKRLSFSWVQPVGNAWKNKWLIPKLTDVSPYIRAAMKYCEKNNVDFINPYCGIPLCHAKGFEDKCLEYTVVREREKKHIIIQKVMDNKIKGPQCKHCSMDKYCLGVWIWYSRLYGVDELIPY